MILSFQAVRSVSSSKQSGYCVSRPEKLALVRLLNQKNKKRIVCNVIDVTINGKNQACDAGLTIVELLDSLGMTSRAIAVEINQQIQPRDTHCLVEVNDGDILEIVTLVGGG